MFTGYYFFRVERNLDALTRQVVGSAQEVTRRVTQTQSSLRRAFIEHLKVQMARRLETKRAWYDLRATLTHERATWFDERAHVESWQLDPCEGPSRVRVRLRRARLGIAPRYLREDARWKLGSCLLSFLFNMFSSNVFVLLFSAREDVQPPLNFLFEESADDSDSKALIYKLHTREHIT